MRIDFIVHSMGSGGGERVLSILANKLVLKGHSIRIVTLSNSIEDAFELNQQIVRVKLKKRTFNNHTINNLFNLFKHYRSKKNRPDIAISFMVETSMLAIIICTLFGIKSIASEHTNHVLKRKNNLRLFTRKYLYRLANKIIVLTEFDRAYYAKHRSNVKVIPNPSTFSINEAPTQRSKTILAVGNLNKYHIKGFDNLIPIVAEVFKKHKDWTLQIVGAIDETSLSFLNKIVVEHQMEDRIVFSGFSNKVSDIMATSDVYIMTSRFEGLPMVLIEAMSQGMVCISYDCETGPSEIITHNYNGILVKDQDTLEMADGLDKLLSDGKLREELRANAPKSIEKFDPDLIVSEWEQVFLEVS